MKKSKGKFRVSAYVSGVRVEKYFTRKTDAQTWQSNQRRESELQKAGIERPDLQLLLFDFAASWMRLRRKTMPLSTSAQDSAKLQKNILPRFGNRPMAMIRTDEWEKFLDQLIVDGLAPATRNRYKALIRKLYRDAMRAKKLVVNPVALIPDLEEKKTRFQYLKTAEEIRAYLVAAQEIDPDFHRMASILLNTGMRISEALVLRWEDLDAKNRTIHVYKIMEKVSGEVINRTKGHEAGRMVPMNNVIASLVGGQTGWVFDNGLGKPRQYFWARNRHERTRKVIGRDDLTIHDLRHTFASHYLMNSGSKSELKEILGHSSEAVTETYSHMAKDHLRARINVVQFK